MKIHLILQHATTTYIFKAKKLILTQNVSSRSLSLMLQDDNVASTEKVTNPYPCSNKE